MTKRDRFQSAIATLLVAMLMAAGALCTPAQNSLDRASPGDLRAIRSYIRDGWHTLARSNAQLARAAVDPKFPRDDRPWPVYVSSKESIERIRHILRGRMTPADLARIELRQLPVDDSSVAEPGLLYLPSPYVVPGGRFNEMYGWDSYFIQLGLLRDGEVELARNMTDNFLYEIENYGKILSANRTYYLSRSQPPFLTRMVLGVYRRQKDRLWLRGTIPLIEKYYRYWTEGSHLVQATGLSRYFDSGDGPAPEVLSSERDAAGRTHYEAVKAYYRTHQVTDYDLSRYYDRQRDQLTGLFYKGDRSMRESGFDPSNRFGPFSIDIIRYNPVCLNSLLYVMETETAEILKILGRSTEAVIWQKRAKVRKRKINDLMWDEKDGLYYDYDFDEQTIRRYPFVTTFYPLWAGIADRGQAARVESNLPLFERAGGLQTSASESGNQWDAPYGWAPMQLIAIEGLRRYGYTKDADRLTVNFLSLVLKEFVAHHRIVEKYDVVGRRSEIGSGLRFGYRSNEIGFGWTNAAFTDLYARLPEAEKPKVRRLGGVRARAAPKAGP